MTARYTARTLLSINVTLPGAGGNAHITFHPVTGGTSVYYTSDTRLQQALEAHPAFGRLFRRAPQAFLPKPAPKAKAKPASGPRHIKVTCPDDAKDYLADRYAVSRTKLRTVAAIQAEALTHGITFDGID